MELCTTQAISNLPNSHHHHHHHHHRFLSINTTLLRSKISLPLKQAPTTRSLHSRFIYFTKLVPRATTSEETSSGANRFVGDEREGVIALEDVPPVEKNVYSESVTAEVPKEEESPLDEQMQTFEFLDKLNIKFDSEDTYSVLLYGSGALVALWLASAIVGAIDSIPLFPKLMEVVGLSYTLWFGTRYLLFKKNRDELATKIEELKQRVLGSNDD